MVGWTTAPPFFIKDAMTNKRKQRIQEQISMIKPTSKSDLKRQCLYLCNLDVAKAEKMYDFLVKDMKGIPDVEPEAKPFMQNLGEQANGLLGWLRDNQDMLSQGVDFIKGLFAGRKGKTLPAAPLPPINE